MSDRRGEGGAAAPPAGRLDLRAINGSGDDDRLVIIGCRCRMWNCPHCGPGYWARVGDRVKPHLAMFHRPRLLTLTINRKHFPSGEAAFEYIKANGLIRRLLRLMGFRKGLSVLSFHPKAQEWPHWHILIDVADVGFVELKRMWRLWRDKWGVGGFDLQVKRRRGDALQAARYALRYCQHQAGTQVEWVERRTRLPRAFEAYGELRSAMRPRSPLNLDDMPGVDAGEHAPREPVETSCPMPEAPASPERAVRRRVVRTVAERLTDCRKGAVVLRRRTWRGCDPSYTFIGQLPITPERLALADKLGEVRTVTLARHVRELVNGATVLDISVPIHDEKAKDLYGRLLSMANAIADADRAMERTRCDVPF